jgi:hypothetical protein
MQNIHLHFKDQRAWNWKEEEVLEAQCQPTFVKHILNSQAEAEGEWKLHRIERG